MPSELTKYRIHKLRRWFGLDSKYHEYIYGECNNLPARKHKINGNVQMKLTQTINGQKYSRWQNFNETWWDQFTPALQA